jgi:hypothetical protein
MLIKNNKLSFSILIYLIVYLLICYIKPSFIFNHDGSLREFGINNSRKTVIPIWILSLLISILSYLFVLNLTF